MHDDDDQPDNDCHKHDRFAPRAEPDDDEGAERDFGECVEYDNVRLKDFVDQVAPPEREGNQTPERHGDNEADNRFPQCRPDMEEESAFRIEGYNGVPDTRRGACEEGIRPAEAGTQLPQNEK